MRNRPALPRPLEAPRPRSLVPQFTEISKKRQLAILILCGDGLTGLPEAVLSVFPQTDVQLCVVHQIRNVTKLEAAEIGARSVCGQVGRALPGLSRFLAQALGRLDRISEISGRVASSVYTTNAIESRQSRFRTCAQATIDDKRCVAIICRHLPSCRVANRRLIFSSDQLPSIPMARFLRAHDHMLQRTGVLRCAALVPA